jgi:hypothetical protein
MYSIIGGFGAENGTSASIHCGKKLAVAGPVPAA